MKLFNYLRNSFVVLLTVLFLAGCENSTENNPDENNSGGADEYFSNVVGTKWQYDVKDSVGNAMGTRSLEVTGNTNINEIDYSVLENKYLYNGTETSSNNYFRTTSAGLYFGVDTSGINEIFPDTLSSEYSIIVDTESNLFSYPLFENKSWTAFKLNLAYMGFEFSLVNLTASYEGIDSIFVPATNELIGAEKVKYKLTLMIPNIENPQNTVSISDEYYIWFSKGPGIVRSSGANILFDLISGGNIFSLLTAEHLTELLSDYQTVK